MFLFDSRGCPGVINSLTLCPYIIGILGQLSKYSFKSVVQMNYLSNYLSGRKIYNVESRGLEKLKPFDNQIIIQKYYTLNIDQY